jgi:uncharacterized membrane protein YdbT with pleckstrin-like domain
MGYIANNLMKEERLILQTRIHWIVFLTPAILTFPTLMLLTNSARSGGTFAFILTLATALLWVNSILKYFTAEFAVTNKRIIAKKGLVSTSTNEILVSKIEAVNIEQSILGRILGYGSVIVTGSGGTKEPFYNIKNPTVFRNCVQEQV